MMPRRDFDLLPEDQKFLDDYGLDWETVVDGSRWVLVHGFDTQQARFGGVHPAVLPTSLIRGNHLEHERTAGLTGLLIRFPEIL